jgi:hypothetical protein
LPDSAPQPLIAPLYEGSLDIVGDIHGEIDALRALLGVLGYDNHGEHPEGRRLVFVGDLVDRGPDSPSVVELVASLVEQDRAQCILGNHELNLLRNDARSGNGWIIHTARPEQQPGGEYEHSRMATDTFRERCFAFLETLPLALVREDLRVVHAAWVAGPVRALEQESGSVREVYERYEVQTLKEMETEGWRERAQWECSQWRSALRDRHASVPLLTALGGADERYQSGNPVRVLTSGVERLASRPFWSGGQWRMCDRGPWWEEYDEAPAVVIGHYWRRLRPISGFGQSARSDLFAGLGPLDWLGPRRNVFCVDYSVGARFVERRRGRRIFDSQLCALRWPEREVWGESGPLNEQAE